LVTGNGKPFRKDANPASFPFRNDKVSTQRDIALAQQPKQLRPDRPESGQYSKAEEQGAEHDEALVASRGTHMQGSEGFHRPRFKAAEPFRLSAARHRAGQKPGNT
jgi:hypothetical protein